MPSKTRRALLTQCLLFGLAGVAAPAFAVDRFDLASYRGKVVLVDFWASWCTPCRHSFPWLNEMQSRYASRGLVIIGANVDRDSAAAARFLQELPAQFEILYDPEGALATQYAIPGMPTSLLFSATGDLIGKHVGFQQASRAEREAELQQLLPTKQSR